MTVLRFILVGLVLIAAGGALLTVVIARVIEARHPPVGRFVETQAGRLHYVEAGSSAARALGTIVLLHGASSNYADLMLALGGPLSARYRVIAFDRPGHGWSAREAAKEAAHPARQAAILAEAMRKLAVREAVIVGHSWSGAVVPNLALDHRDVTGAILLLSGVTHPWPGGKLSWYYHPVTSFMGWLFTRIVTTPMAALLLEPTVKAVFAPQVPPPGYAEAARIALVLRPPVFQANAEDIAILHGAVSAQSARYPDIQVPTTVIGGDADRIVWTDLHSRSFAREVPGAKLVILPGVGHMPHHASRDGVLREVEALAARARPTMEASRP